MDFHPLVQWMGNRGLQLGCPDQHLYIGKWLFYWNSIGSMYGIYIYIHLHYGWVSTGTPSISNCLVEGVPPTNILQNFLIRCCFFFQNQSRRPHPYLEATARRAVSWRKKKGKHEIFPIPIWLVVEPTPLENTSQSQIGSFVQLGVNIKNIWNYHLAMFMNLMFEKGHLMKERGIG